MAALTRLPRGVNLSYLLPPHARIHLEPATVGSFPWPGLCLASAYLTAALPSRFAVLAHPGPQPWGMRDDAMLPFALMQDLRPPKPDWICVRSLQDFDESVQTGAFVLVLCALPWLRSALCSRCCGMLNAKKAANEE
jgi:hypothetical protein